MQYSGTLKDERRKQVHLDCESRRRANMRTIIDQLRVVLQEDERNNLQIRNIITDENREEVKRPQLSTLEVMVKTIKQIEKLEKSVSKLQRQELNLLLETKKLHHTKASCNVATIPINHLPNSTMNKSYK